MGSWDSYSEKFLALSQREKWLLMIGGAVGLFFLLLTFIVEPVIKTSDSLKSRIRTDSNQAIVLKGEIQSMKNKLRQDPDKELNTELKQLMEESQKLSEELSKKIESLLSPEQMAYLLQNVLAGSKGLKLVSMESQAARPVLSGEDAGMENYYVHPVRIELTGTYFQLKDYLKSLEAMDVKYYWSKFQYQVEEYPQARLILEVYTLGTRQEFIGG
ncbi:type 4a pilus biogenesis protein PilO [Vibrio hannami]|uniref:type 4a pilus biogenesis protein PilO n=1 Tax=Vibrio hannami TaxID=2717094 RepID=UPI00240F96C5|nr:type 4a pilus biogenesis protein PilO [Vibrio hannami]MDG3084801.1 type 4a pilus biogenesis protein PilO [Vibrio hannami]